jgi:hypothetical protein
MKKPRVKFDYSKLSDPNLLVFSQSVVASMTLSVSIFTDPNPSIDTVGIAVDKYATALSKAAMRDKVAVSIKEDTRKELALLLAKLAAYVNNVSGGDETKLQASGFLLVKTPETNPPIDAPQNMQVLPGTNHGEIAISIDRVKGALCYNFQVTPAPLTPNSVWETLPSTIRKVVFENLVIGQIYWFRVVAIGPRNQVTICNPQARSAA